MEQKHGPRADLGTGDLHRGKRRLGHGGDGQTVKAGDGDIFGDEQTNALEGPHGSKGDGIVVANQRRRETGSLTQQLLHRVHSPVHGGEHRIHQLRIKGELVILQRLLEGFVPGPVVAGREGVIQEADLPMAQLRQMLHHQEHGQIVVHGYTAAAAQGEIVIHYHQGDIQPVEVFHIPVGQLRAQENGAPGSGAGQYLPQIDVGEIIKAHNRQGVAPPAALFLHGVHDLGDKTGVAVDQMGMFAVLEKTDGFAFAAVNGFGGADLIAVFPQHLSDLFTLFRADTGLVIENKRNGCQ